MNFKKHPPWFDSEIHEMFRIKERLRKKYKRTLNEEDYNSFSRQRKLLKQTIECKKQAYFAVDPCSDEHIIQKKFWSHVKSKSKCSRIPESVHYKGRFRSDTKQHCEMFNNFFCDQFSENSKYDIPVDLENSETNFYFSRIYNF